ncbi:MAG TPA: glucose 1-dehydrogenase [Bacteroidetes bacterium]|nr:glucose 1-dehydrogenase [Bacteroidota bacterium]
MLDLKLSGKAALVTGASSGIGRATARLLAKEGVKVALVARNEARLQQVQEQIARDGGEALVAAGDVTNTSFAEYAVAKTVETFGGLDILVNAAGILETGTIENTTLEAWDRMMNVNLRAVFYLMHLAVPHLVKSKGVIINVSSVNGVRSFPGVLAYNVSKSAVDQLTRCAALELADKGVRVNSVNPGVTITELHRRAGMDEEAYRKFIEHSYDTHPIARGLNRMAEPEDVAHLIVYLASPLAEWITGVNYLVDGGRGQTCFR